MCSPPRAAHSDEASGRIPSQREIRTVASSSRMVARTPLRRRLPTEKKICTELPEATSYRLHWSTRSTTRSVRCRISFLKLRALGLHFSPRSTADGLCGLNSAENAVLKPTRSLVRKPPVTIASELTRVACASFAKPQVAGLHC